MTKKRPKRFGPWALQVGGTSRTACPLRLLERTSKILMQQKDVRTRLNVPFPQNYLYMHGE